MHEIITIYKKTKRGGRYISESTEIKQLYQQADGDALFSRVDDLVRGCGFKTELNGKPAITFLFEFRFTIDKTVDSKTRGKIVDENDEVLRIVALLEDIFISLKSFGYYKETIDNKYKLVLLKCTKVIKPDDAI